MDTIGNIFKSGSAARENITDGVHEKTNTSILYTYEKFVQTIHNIGRGEKKKLLITSFCFFSHIFSKAIVLGLGSGLIINSVPHEL